jgi:hypothetical protein
MERCLIASRLRIGGDTIDSRAKLEELGFVIQRKVDGMELYDAFLPFGWEARMMSPNSTHFYDEVRQFRMSQLVTGKVAMLDIIGITDAV